MLVIHESFGVMKLALFSVDYQSKQLNCPELSNNARIIVNIPEFEEFKGLSIDFCAN